MKTRIICLIIVGVLCLCLFGCNDNGENQSFTNAYEDNDSKNSDNGTSGTNVTDTKDGSDTSNTDTSDTPQGGNQSGTNGGGIALPEVNF